MTKFFIVKLSSPLFPYRIEEPTGSKYDYDYVYDYEKARDFCVHIRECRGYDCKQYNVYEKTRIPAREK